MLYKLETSNFICSNTVFKDEASSLSVLVFESVVTAIIAILFSPLFNSVALDTPEAESTKETAETLTGTVLNASEAEVAEATPLPAVIALPEASHSTSVACKVRVISADNLPAESLPIFLVITLT